MNIYQRFWRSLFPAKPEQPDHVKIRLDTMREHYDTKVQHLERRIEQLQPKPIMIVQCPNCNAQRRTERLSRTNAEAQEDGWWWSYVIFGLSCLTCGTEFVWKTELKKVESIKDRRVRLEREAKEREARRKREEERRRRREEEEEDEERRRRRGMSSSSSSSSRSPSFGGGRSGGGGSSGRIRR